MAPNETPSRVLNWLAMVAEAWGDKFREPDVAYKFSNDREFKDSGSGHGIYNPNGN